MNADERPEAPPDLERELEQDEKLGFVAQCRIVRDGLKKGVNYDGCTGVPDFDFGADCCGEHDYHYQTADIPRAEADKRLRECLREKGYFFLPWIYWLGVRTIGWRYYGKNNPNYKGPEA